MSKAAIKLDPEKVEQAWLDQTAGSRLWYDAKRGIGVRLQADMDEYKILYLEAYADPSAKVKRKNVTLRVSRELLDDNGKWHWEDMSEGTRRLIPDVDEDDAPAAIMIAAREAVRLLGA